MTNDRVSRGRRVREIQDDLGINAKQFVEVLQRATDALGLPVKWYEKRLSTIANGGQDLSLEDVAILEAVDPKRRSWHWAAFGVERLGGKRGAKLSGGIPAPKPGKKDQRESA